MLDAGVGSCVDERYLLISLVFGTTQGDDQHACAVNSGRYRAGVRVVDLEARGLGTGGVQT